MNVPRLDGAAESFEPPSGSTQPTLGVPEQPGRAQASDGADLGFQASITDDTQYEEDDDVFIPRIVKAEREKLRQLCLRQGRPPPPIEQPRMGLLPPLTAEDEEIRRLLRPPSPPRDPRLPPPSFPRPPAEK